MTFTLTDQFTKIHAINALVGNSDVPELSSLKRQATLLLHEVEELLEAIETKDINGIRDGQADIAFVLAGLEYMLPCLRTDLESVIESNMTKFDITEEDAKLTQAKYEGEGIKTTCQYQTTPMAASMGLFDEIGYYVTYVDGEQTINGQKVPDRKWLKSHRFVEPQFSYHPIQDIMAQLI